MYTLAETIRDGIKYSLHYDARDAIREYLGNGE